MSRSLAECLVPAPPPSQSLLGVWLSPTSKGIGYLNTMADMGVSLSFFQLFSYKMGIIVLPLLLMQLHLSIVRMSREENMSSSDTTVMGAVKKSLK